MNFAIILLVIHGPLPQWLNFLVVSFAIVVTAIGTSIWFLAFRKVKKRKRRHHEQRHHAGQESEKRPVNPTLAESGGLPPKRGGDSPPTEL